MSMLEVFHNGELLKTLHLNEEMEYHIGRGASCDIVIEDATAVSRQHIRIFFDGMEWQVEVLSKFGGVLQLGAEVDNLSLENGTSFSLKGYEFRYKDKAKAKTKESKATSDPTSLGEDSKVLVPYSGGSATSASNMNENTIVGGGRGIPFLRIILDDGTEDVLRLEGNLWTAGRDLSCEVVIRDRGASRRHFEISMVGDKTYVVDLNSANGTFVNGQKIDTEQPTEIKSGDILSVLSVKITFEVRDPNFDRNLQMIPQPAFEPIGPHSFQAPVAAQAATPASANENLPATVKPNIKDIKNWQNWEVEFKGKKARLGDHKKVIYGVIASFFIILVALDPAAPPKKQQERLPANVHEAYANLTAEKKTYLRDSFKLAKNLLIQKNYELALKELNEIHEIIPFYKDSRKMEAECKQWIEVKVQREYLIRQKQMAEELERRISSKVAQCDAAMTPKTTQMQLSKCLGDVMDLNPDHPGIRRLQAIIEEREAEAERRKAQRAEYLRKAKIGEGLYYKAKRLKDRGKDYSAIKAYVRYINSSYPDRKGLKRRARRELADLRENLQFKVESMIKRADSYFDQSQYREAMKTLKEAEKIDPTSRTIASTRQKFSKQITRQMKTIYEDSVLEESLGNVEAAKDKWRKIKELSYPGDPYFSKAKQKLKKYGEQ